VRLQLYHEATLCNLLEVVLFHQDACKAAGERFAAKTAPEALILRVDRSLVELSEYCYRKIVQLTGG
jgi:hypothetical protein